jgi:D-alanine transaminase
VSVLDRGFIFGDGIYEVVPVYGGKLFRFDEHLARLAAAWPSCASQPAHREQWLERCRKLVAALVEHAAARPTRPSTSRSRAASRCATT